MNKRRKQPKNCPTSHKLTIHSLNDAQASCICGWSYSFTGQRTLGQIKSEFKKRLDH